MGWYFMSSLDGRSGPRAYLDAQFSFERSGRTSRVLRSALVRMQTYYAAVEVCGADLDRQVFGCVCLVEYNRRERDGYIFGYKAMEEAMGPYQTECPIAILDLLTPTDNRNALVWRQACRETLVVRASKPKLRHGHVVTFAEPMTFADGRTHRRLRVHIDPRHNRRIRFRALDGGWLYRICRLKELTYTVAPADAGVDQTPGP